MKEKIEKRKKFSPICSSSHNCVGRIYLMNYLAIKQIMTNFAAKLTTITD
jgi:hypothetical protein